METTYSESFQEHSSSRLVPEMSFRDEDLTDGGNGSLKKSKKKLKGESAWRPEGPRDPFALVSGFV